MEKERIKRAYIALEGLAIGDAFGEMFSYSHETVRRRMENNKIPPAPWWHTDDTEMALAIVENLSFFGKINQNSLAQRFANRFMDEPDRGYGKMTRIILKKIINGDDWKNVSQSAFSGEGSMGNGAAMRVAPLGAYFSDNLETVVREAKASAEITHAHPEGRAGAIAIAVASATSWNMRGKLKETAISKIFDYVLNYTPQSKTYDGIKKASELSHQIEIKKAVKILGNGSLVTSQDTVPYAIWCATKNIDNFVEAMIETVSGGGDCDTNCAMAGGIVASFSDKSIPKSWLEAKEKFRLEANYTIEEFESTKESF